MLGLQISYQNDIATRKYFRKLTALCDIPDVHIKPIFEGLAMLACEPLKNLIAYINDTWITSSLHGPHRWSVFGMPIRADNDIEGWHNKLNKKVNHRSPLYLLVTALHNEASQIPMNIELLKMKSLKRRQRKKYVRLHKKLFGYWNDYKKGRKSAQKLLNESSHLVNEYN